jgi:hypothetical protein
MTRLGVARLDSGVRDACELQIKISDIVVIPQNT